MGDWPASAAGWSRPAFCPPAEVSRAAAFVGFILIAGAARLHIGVALLSWLPPAGRQTARFVLRTVAVVGAGAA